MCCKTSVGITGDSGMKKSLLITFGGFFLIFCRAPLWSLNASGAQASWTNDAGWILAGVPGKEHRRADILSMETDYGMMDVSVVVSKGLLKPLGRLNSNAANFFCPDEAV